MKPSGKVIILIVLAVLSLAVLVAAPLTGIKSISPAVVLNPGSGSLDALIFWKIRMPRVLTAFIAGSALAVSGMVFQAIFRNPLATPFTLGVSGGAALGASLALRLGLAFTVAGFTATSFSAFMGAVLSILLVYGLTRVKRGFSTATMLLAGVAVSFFFSSLILFLQYISDFTGTFRILRWLMGGFDVVGFASLWNMAPFTLVGCAAVFYLTRELNLLATGDEIAASRGVEVKKVKKVLFFATSLMVGGVVSVCGPIGFVGMMAPHACRLVVGPDHRYLAPASLLFGGAFLVACDTLARTVIAPAEIPTGVVTALLGGPFFVWLLLGGASERALRH